ncbi:MAG: hypothetical protein ABIO72_05680 [Patescibacteria group bacterium]
MRQQKLPVLIFWIVGIALFTAVAGAGYLYYQNDKTQKELAALKDHPQQLTKEKTDDLLAEVSKVIVLPMDETPTIATVFDLERLKDQPFFANAKIGDKVLIYSKAKKAILYDVEAHKVVEVAPLNFNTRDSTTTENIPVGSP